MTGCRAFEAAACFLGFVPERRRVLVSERMLMRTSTRAISKRATGERKASCSGPAWR